MSKNRWPTLGGGRWGSLHTVRNEFYKDMMRCAPLLSPPCSLPAPPQCGGVGRTNDGRPSLRARLTRVARAQA